MDNITLDKPPIGAPCNGCGICCKIVVCMNGAFVQGLVNTFGDTVPGPCPALVKRVDGSHSCGIVMNPKKYLKHRPYPADVMNFGKMIQVRRLKSWTTLLRKLKMILFG